MSIFKYIRFLMKYRNIAEILSRGMCVLKRYGLSTDKMQHYLNTYQTLLARYDITPTLFIAGDVLEKHPQLIHTFMSRNVDLGIHGYRHIDLAKLSFKKQKQQIERALKVFRRFSVTFSGFRCPYLNWNSHTLHVLEDCNISWDSSKTLLWNVIDKKNTKEWSQWKRAISLYNYRDASHYISLPHLQSSLLEIPVSLPDDAMLIDRLATTTTHEMWTHILDETYDKGELFTLQLHPERIIVCRDILESVVKASKSYEPPVWIAPLSEIARWWREKETFHFKITEEGNSRYHIEALCSERALVLVKNAKVKCPDRDFFNGYTIIKGNHFTLESSHRPAIGVSQRASSNVIKFLKNEGFFFEVSDKKEHYGIYCDGNMTIEENERKILHMIEQSPFPLIRFWRWPDGTRSALSITGDIDVVTLSDFFMRISGK